MIQNTINLLGASKVTGKPLKLNASKGFMGVNYSNTTGSADGAKNKAKIESKGFGFSEEVNIEEDK